MYKQFENYSSGIISEAKNRQDLSRAKYRGLMNMQIQAYLSASAQNIKRLVAFYLYLLKGHIIFYHYLIKLSLKQKNKNGFSLNFFNSTLRFWH